MVVVLSLSSNLIVILVLNIVEYAFWHLLNTRLVLLVSDLHFDKRFVMIQVKSKDREFESIPHLVAYFTVKKVPLVIGGSQVFLKESVANISV